MIAVGSVAVDSYHGDAVHLRAHPYASVGDLGDAEYAMVANLLVSHMNERLVHRVEDVESGGSAYPEHAVAVLAYAEYGVGCNALRIIVVMAEIACRAVAGVDDGDASVHVSRHHQSVAHICGTPQLIVSHALHVVLVVVSKLACAGVKHVESLPVGR